MAYVNPEIAEWLELANDSLTCEFLTKDRVGLMLSTEECVEIALQLAQGGDWVNHIDKRRSYQQCLELTERLMKNV